MLHVGHTMATPEIDIREAIDLFASLGLDATESLCMTLDEQGDRHGPAVGDARMFSHDWPESDIREVRSKAHQAGVPLLTITQYVRAINHPQPDIRRQACEAIARYIDFTAAVGGRFLRVYGGEEQFGPESIPAAVTTLQELAQRAESCDVTLLIENHPGTLTVTGEATCELIRAVGSPQVRALYDPANVLVASEEPLRHTFDIQRDQIAYVHVKDFRRDGDQRVACPVGEGDVPWKDILGWLKESGFTGPLSYEYERKWHRDQLPPPQEGLKRSVDFVRSSLED